MNNALRITLMVFVLLLLVVSAGSVFVNHHKSKIADYHAKIKEIDEKISKLDEVLAQNIAQRKELEKIQKQVENFDKAILEYDSPHITYDYLLQITDRLEGDFVFDFTYSGQKEQDGLITNTYLLRGETRLNLMYKMISHLEKQSPIYYVYDVAVSSRDITISDTISYSFMLDSVSEKAVPREVNISLKDISLVPEVSRLFTCDLEIEKIAARLAEENRNIGLFDLNGARLIAIVGQEAYFRDNQGLFQILKPGDYIKAGILSSIDSKLGLVTFIIDNGEGVKDEKIFTVESGGN
jgi:hypothetical protein